MQTLKDIYESFTSNVIDKTKSMTQEEKRADVAQIQFEDHEVERICHDRGVFTYEDAKNVKSIKRWFQEEKDIRSFNEFKYFTGLLYLDNFAFNKCEFLQHIELPENLVSLGDRPFQKCKSLQSIVIPDEISTIDFATFEDCTSLKSVFLPKNLKVIGNYAFANCESLKNVNIPEGVTSIGEQAFSYCMNLEKIDLPASLKHIGSRSFFGNNKISDVTLPQNLIHIGDQAFSHCNLKTFNLPDSLNSLGISVFQGNLNLEKIFVSKKCPQYDNCQFAGITKIDPDTNQILEESFTSNVIDKTKSKSQKEKREDLSYIKFEDPGVERICHEHGVYTYADARKLESINGWFIGENIKKFNEFKYFTNIKSLTNNDFLECTSLEEISLPPSIKILGSYLFTRCIRLKDVKIPENVSTIGGHVFFDCNSLTSIEIPDKVDTIGVNAFGYCKNLKEIKLPKYLSYIKAGAFSHCTSLESVRLPESVKEIADNTFTECTNLKNINIPSNLLKIGKFVFKGCEDLSIEISKAAYLYNKIKNDKSFKDYTIVESSVNESFTKNIDPRQVDENWKKYIEVIKASTEPAIHHLLLQKYVKEREFKTESTGAVYYKEPYIDYETFLEWLTILLKKKSLIWQPEGILIYRVDDAINQVSIRDSETRASYVNMSNIEDHLLKIMKRQSKNGARLFAKMCTAFLIKRLDKKTIDILREEITKEIDFDNI